MDTNDIVARITKEVLLRIRDQDHETRDRIVNNGEDTVRLSGNDIAYTLEYSLLGCPDISKEQLIQASKIAKRYRMANICVLPYHVSLALEYLRGSGVKVCTIIQQAYGASSTAGKVAEAKEAIKNGAEEIDVAMNILAIKDGKFKDALKDISEVVNVAKGKGTIKAIYEQGLYTEEEKVAALSIAKESGAEFIKISNYYSPKRASVEDVKFVREIVGDHIRLKIDGSISTAAHVRELMEAGAHRFGCSKAIEVIEGN